MMYVNEAHNIYIKMSLKSDFGVIYIVTMSLMLRNIGASVSPSVEV